MNDFNNLISMYIKKLVSRRKRFFSFQNSFIRNIPVSLRTVSIMSLLMVSAATFYSIDQILMLEKSTGSLLHIAVPLKEATYQLEGKQIQIEFLLHKFIALRDPDYYLAILDKIEQQKRDFDNLNLLLKEYPEIHSVMDLLYADLNTFWTKLYELKHLPGKEIPKDIEDVVDFDIKRVHNHINTLAMQQAAATKIAAEHLTLVLVLLVIGTVVIGTGISILYASAAIRPMLKVSNALKRIGEGKYDKKLSLEGLQELRDLSRDVNNMQDKLGKLETAKTEFLSLISHELKTPLASFESGIGLLLSSGVGTLSDSQKKVVEIMQKQTLQLETSIQELLDMQAIQNQRMVMDIRSSYLTSIIHDAIEQISPLTTKKNQHIKEIIMSDNIQAFVDPDRTRQILLNLLSNAYKYSPPNSQISVTIKKHKSYAEIIVEDEGTGIPDEYIDKACERFFQVPTAGAHLRGTGLGLAIASEFSKIQNGTLYLRNRPLGGLRVTILLPLYNMDSNNAAPQKKHTKITQKEA